LSDVLKLTAVDLANVNVDIKRLETGYWTKVISRPHGVDVMYILEERTRNLQEPGKDTVSLGGTIATLSGSMEIPKGIICESGAGGTGGDKGHRPED